MSRSLVRFASTVMLVRDADGGFEVLLLRRNKDLAFAGGAHVFPGGSVDKSDGQLALMERCSGLTVADAEARLGTTGALSFYVAALREAFEEAGILLTTEPPGRSLDDLDDELRSYRQSLVMGQCSFTEIVETLDLHLDVGALVYVAHWVTPEGAPRRFDTRFFLASVPSHQRATPDRSEIVGQVWATPSHALDQYHRGHFELVLPTVKNLEFLASFGSVDSLMRGARALTSVERIQPRFYRNADGSVAVALPGSPEYERASATVLEHGEALPTRPSNG
jgi:8-oxo-dGTP pyrophosphatase MutT (NUDIX family)